MALHFWLYPRLEDEMSVEAARGVPGLVWWLDDKVKPGSVPVQFSDAQAMRSFLARGAAALSAFEAQHVMDLPA